jgi:isopropylmalate/homocitrate/citramalate synthase
MALLDGLPAQATVVEVGPRDGLQNEAGPVPAAGKVAFIERLAAAGLPIVEVAAFVRPDTVPQMADAAEVVAALRRSEDRGRRSAVRRPHTRQTRYVALVPNLRGYHRAREAGAGEVAVFTAATETFSLRNTHCSLAESLSRIAQVTAAARADGVPVRAYVSVAWRCPYEGPVDPQLVERLTGTLLDAGAWQVALGDTIGAATPLEVVRLVERLLAHAAPAHLALHCHDTRGAALANVLAALQLGLSTFDASAGGLGGCPFAPGAAGNLATEALVYLLHGLGVETGVSLDAVAAATEPLEPYLGRPLSRAPWRGGARTGP